MSRDTDVHVEDKIRKLLDGELPPDEAAAVRAHSALCERCGEALADLKAVYGALKADREPELLRPMWPVVKRGLTPRSLPTFNFSFGLATSVAAAAGVVLGVLLGTFHELPRYTPSSGGTRNVESYLGDDSVPTLDEVYISSFEGEGEEQ
jgi:anti-sigma factor RsiW